MLCSAAKLVACSRSHRPADVLDLTDIPTRIRAARAESDQSGRRLIVETLNDREMLENALREASFRSAPDGSFRRTDAWGALNVYTGEIGATFVASTGAGGFRTVGETSAPSLGSLVSTLRSPDGG